MKLRKLLQKVRRQSCAYWIEEIIYRTYDGRQWKVIVWILGPRNAISWTEGRFRTHEECEEYIKDKKWENIRYNIAELRKKYHRPPKNSKSPKKSGRTKFVFTDSIWREIFEQRMRPFYKLAQSLKKKLYKDTPSP